MVPVSSLNGNLIAGLLWLPERIEEAAQSFPLYRRWWFTGDVIHNPVDVGYFIDDSDRDPVQDLIGDSGPVGSHEVSGGDRAEGQGVVIGAAVTHDTYGAHVG